jgi:hypothetical protein
VAPFGANCTVAGQPDAPLPGLPHVLRSSPALLRYAQRALVHPEGVTMAETEIPRQTGVLEPETIVPADIKLLPPDSLLVSLLGVNYVHLKTRNGGDLYLTVHGLPHLDLLQPESWYEKEWFEAQRQRLTGTSAVYAVPTKEIGGRRLRLVVKYSRVGQDVPLETNVIYQVLNAEFNSPFEEFTLVESVRRGEYGPPEVRARPQRPLCIYVPPERLQLWQTGRSEAKIASRIARHPGIEIDILRDYILVYEWLEGIDAVQAQQEGRLNEEELKKLTARATEELKAKGFRVLDMKPDHIIVRVGREGRLAQGDNGVSYGLVDFELLERTPEYERQVKAARRSEYLRRQRDRFAPHHIPFPPHLKPMNVLGVDYVHGQTESTGGALWVVGRDPELFDYFLPERWRKTPQIQLNPRAETFYTYTKDNIHLVWKVSRVGETPEADEDGANAQRLIACGFPSPFEEFAMALRLRELGIPTIYPRAIYMTGHTLGQSEPIGDWSRYESHKAFLTPEGERVLRPGRNYIAVWGYWNGPDEMLASRDGEYFKGINAAQALAMGYLDQLGLDELLRRERLRLEDAGLEVVRLRPEQILLSLDSRGVLIRDPGGCLETRVCNFQCLRWRENEK